MSGPKTPKQIIDVSVLCAETAAKTKHIRHKRCASPTPSQDSKRRESTVTQKTWPRPRKASFNRNLTGRSFKRQEYNVIVEFPESSEEECGDSGSDEDWTPQQKGASRKVAGFSSNSDEGNEAQEDEGQEEESEAHVAEDESQEEDEAEEAENSPLPRAQGKNAKGKSVRYRWKAMDNEFGGDLPTFLGESKMNVEGKDPIDFFSHLFTEEMIDDIVFNTNQYAIQKGNENLGLTSEEFKTFLGMNMVMSYIKYPRARMYWSSEEGLRLDLVADAMPVNRFEKILRYVHFVDNYSIDPENADRFVKIRPFLNALQGTFSASLDPEEYQSVDEMMIPFMGRLSIKQYVPEKTKPWGVKVWLRAGSSDYMYSFEPYQGPSGGRQNKRWYIRVFFHFVDVAVVNAWFLYKMSGNEAKDLLHFKASTARALINAGSVTIRSRGTPSATPPPVKRRAVVKVPPEVRYAPGNHWPKLNVTNAMRCSDERCHRRTKYTCLQCVVFVCPDCFANFHVRR